LLLLIFIMSFGLANFQGIVGLYVVDRFDFSTRQVGILWMVLGVALLVGQGGLAGPLAKRMGESRLIWSGLAGGTLGFVLIALAVDFHTVLLAVGFFILVLAVIGPVLNACMLRYAGERQGTVMGMSSASASLGRVAGPLQAGWLYELGITLPFWCGAVVMLLGTILARYILGKSKAVDDK